MALVNPAFTAAIDAGDLDLVRSLLAAQPNLLITTAPSPALRAMAAGHVALADELAAGRQPLSVFEAAAFDDTARLSTLIDAERSVVDSWSVDGWQPIHLAARYGRAEAARALLDADGPADSTSRNAAAVQPLHLAAAAGHLELVWILIASDVGVDVRDPDGRTPLMLAAAGDHPDSVQALLTAGADPELTDGAGLQAVDLADSAQVRDQLA